MVEKEELTKRNTIKPSLLSTLGEGGLIPGLKKAEEDGDEDGGQ
jgi:hypothetical protein